MFNIFTLSCRKRRRKKEEEKRKKKTRGNRESQNEKKEKGKKLCGKSERKIRENSGFGGFGRGKGIIGKEKIGFCLHSEKENHADANMTIIMVTHDRNVAKLADRMVELKDGHLA